MNTIDDWGPAEARPLDRGLRKIKLSRISALHYVQLAYRACLLLAAATVYVVGRATGSPNMFGGYEYRTPILTIIWLVFAAEMLLRFFPSNNESMGCQKQFAKNYVPRPGGDGRAIRKNSWRMTVPVAASWTILNGAIGILYLAGVLDWGEMILVALVYSVCDMICILFFCPFQTWMMKNKCCGSCRIYNWDYAMMFTPLLFIGSAYTLSLAALSVGLLARWELTFHRHPERFSEETNCALSCQNCQEKLCHHKKQLQGFLRRQGELIKRPR